MASNMDSGWSTKVKTKMGEGPPPPLSKDIKSKEDIGMKIANETIKKLTSTELNDLGCLNIGIVVVIGEPKKRTKNMRRKEEGGIIYFFDTETFYTHEFIMLQDKWNGKLSKDYNSDKAEGFSYAYRVFDERTGEHVQNLQSLAPLGFLR